MLRLADLSPDSHKFSSAQHPCYGWQVCTGVNFCLNSGASVTGSEGRGGVPGFKISSLHVSNRTVATFKRYMAW